MDDDDPLYISGFDGKPLDPMPAIERVLALCPVKIHETPRELAVLAQKFLVGKYIPVAVFERTGRKPLTMVLHRIVSWTREHFRHEQIMDPDVQRLRPYLELAVDEGCCARAKSMSQRFLALSEIESLPLIDCWQNGCGCWYRTLSRGDIRRRQETANKT